jgi:hypothetical protein
MSLDETDKLRERAPGDLYRPACEHIGMFVQIEAMA